MGVFFNVRDVMELGVEIEKNGETFYKEAIGANPRNDLKCLFEWLAAEERTHKTIFEEMLRDTEKHQRFHENASQEEFHAYLKDLADSRVFKNSEEVKKAIARAKTAPEVLALALRFEKDSILLFEQMKKVTPPEFGQKEIDKLIAEETGHISKISNLKRQMEAVKPGR